MKQQKNRMQIKDLISIGVYTALYFMIVAIAALLTIFIIPGYSYVFIPVLSALFAGSIFMLLVAKVAKFGAITIMGSVMGLFFFLMGRFPGALPISILFAVLADGIAYFFKYKNKNGLLLSYLFFSFNPIGPVIPLFLFPQLYAEQLAKVGKDSNYIKNAFLDISQNTFIILLVSLVIAAVVGGILGQKMIKKHFQRAGIV